MSINNKAIGAVFSDREHLEQTVNNAVYLLNEELEDLTIEEAFDVFMTRLSIIASEYEASEILKYNLDIYYEHLNDELTMDILQNEIDSKKRASKKWLKK